MNWNFPLATWPWLSHDLNVLWMTCGIVFFIIVGIACLFGASQAAGNKYEPSTPKQIREFYYVSLALFGLALVTLILGAWVTIPACVVVISLYIYYIGGSLVRTFGYAFLGWPNPKSTPKVKVG